TDRNELEEKGLPTTVRNPCALHRPARTTVAERQKTLNRIYSGYHRHHAIADLELARVGPDTPGGEYLRKFWHPIELAGELKDRPLAVRVLGEDLVLFRNLSGTLGLLHRHCPHRGASLEF